MLLAYFFITFWRSATTMTIRTGCRPYLIPQTLLSTTIAVRKQPKKPRKALHRSSIFTALRPVPELSINSSPLAQLSNKSDWRIDCQNWSLHKIAAFIFNFQKKYHLFKQVTATITVTHTKSFRSTHPCLILDHRHQKPNFLCNYCFT